MAEEADWQTSDKESKYNNAINEASVNCWKVCLLTLLKYGRNVQYVYLGALLHIEKNPQMTFSIAHSQMETFPPATEQAVPN